MGGTCGAGLGLGEAMPGSGDAFRFSLLPGVSSGLTSVTVLVQRVSRAMPALQSQAPSTPALCMSELGAGHLVQIPVPGWETGCRNKTGRLLEAV